MAKKDLSKVSISEVFSNDKPTQDPNICYDDLTEDIKRFDHKVIDKKEGGRPTTIPTHFKNKQYKLDPQVSLDFGVWCKKNKKVVSVVLNDMITDFLNNNQ